MSRKKFLLVDAHALIYRAYYAMPNLTDSEGHLVNAVFGFSKMLLNAITYFDPEYAAVCFDHPKPTFRHKKFDGYKAQRAKMPDDLIPQIQIVKDVVTALGIPKFEIEGFEADDLIGTVNCKVENMNRQLLTVIVTGDQDSFQLVDDDTHIWMPARGKQQRGDIEYDAALVEKKLGIKPLQVIDLKALMGDNSDNIPGIKGVGPKTAVTLVKRFNTVEKIYEFLKEHPEGDETIKGALLQKLLNGEESALMSKDLATIECAAPIDFDLENCRVTTYDKNKVIEIFQNLGFKSLINTLPKDAFESSVQEALF